VTGVSLKSDVISACYRFSQQFQILSGLTHIRYPVRCQSECQSGCQS